ncbi:hypothetical protein [Burkholderia sp. JP2-270]|uniref:hypothetical protein n=1 Tax=Burkholderia sp. JP2-270 TaxID=2217913 RepID=UPI0013A6E0B4|nr:hypothetical protein [Burkholderia sp. JP2-270]
MRAADRNRTARVVADRLDGRLPQQHDALQPAQVCASRCPASLHRQTLALPRRVPGSSRIGRHAHTPRRGFRMRIPSRGCDARLTLQPIFKHASHQAARRAPPRSASPRSPSARVRRDGWPTSQAQLEETT